MKKNTKLCLLQVCNMMFVVEIWASNKKNRSLLGHQKFHTHCVSGTCHGFWSKTSQVWSRKASTIRITIYSKTRWALRPHILSISTPKSIYSITSYSIQCRLPVICTYGVHNKEYSVLF